MLTQEIKEKRKRVRMHVLRMGEIVYKTDSNLNFRKTFSRQMITYKDLNYSIVKRITEVRPPFVNINVNK